MESCPQDPGSPDLGRDMSTGASFTRGMGPGERAKSSKTDKRLLGGRQGGTLVTVFEEGGTYV